MDDPGAGPSGIDYSLVQDDSMMDYYSICSNNKRNVPKARKLNYEKKASTLVIGSIPASEGDASSEEHSGDETEEVDQRGKLNTSDYGAQSRRSTEQEQTGKQIDMSVLEKMDVASFETALLRNYENAGKFYGDLHRKYENDTTEKSSQTARTGKMTIKNTEATRKSEDKIEYDCMETVRVSMAQNARAAADVVHEVDVASTQSSGSEKAHNEMIQPEEEVSNTIHPKQQETTMIHDNAIHNKAIDSSELKGQEPNANKAVVNQEVAQQKARILKKKKKKGDQKSANGKSNKQDSKINKVSQMGAKEKVKNLEGKKECSTSQNASSKGNIKRANSDPNKQPEKLNTSKSISSQSVFRNFGAKNPIGNKKLNSRMQRGQVLPPRYTYTPCKFCLDAKRNLYAGWIPSEADAEVVRTSYARATKTCKSHFPEACEINHRAAKAAIEEKYILKDAEDAMDVCVATNIGRESVKIAPEGSNVVAGTSSVQDVPVVETTKTPVARNKSPRVCKVVKHPVAKNVESLAAKLVKSPIAENLEHPVATIVESPVVKLVNSPAAKIVESPVAKIVESPVAKVVDSLATKLVESSIVKLVDFPASKLEESPIAKNLKHPVVKVVKPPVAKIVECPIAENMGNPIAKLVESPVAKLVDSPAAKIVKSPNAKLARIAKLESKLAELKSKFAKLRSETVGVAPEFAEAASEIAKRASENAEIESQVAKLDSRVAQLMKPQVAKTVEFSVTQAIEASNAQQNGILHYHAADTPNIQITEIPILPHYEVDYEHAPVNTPIAGDLTNGNHNNEGNIVEQEPEELQLDQNTVARRANVVEKNTVEEIKPWKCFECMQTSQDDYFECQGKCNLKFHFNCGGFENKEHSVAEKESFLCKFCRKKKAWWYCALCNKWSTQQCFACVGCKTWMHYKCANFENEKALSEHEAQFGFWHCDECMKKPSDAHEAACSTSADRKAAGNLKAASNSSKNQKKKPKYICSQCEKSSQRDSVRCHRCEGWVHMKCTPFRTLAQIPSPWVCQKCKDNETPEEKELYAEMEKLNPTEVTFPYAPKSRVSNASKATSIEPKEEPTSSSSEKAAEMTPGSRKRNTNDKSDHSEAKKSKPT